MKEQVCPVWAGYLITNPIRRLFQNPTSILAPHVNAGMTVLDIGCAMGFFSLPLTRMVGSQGKAICVDLQYGMIRSLEKRANKAGVAERIQTRVCRSDSLGINDLAGTVDFALASAVLHETPDPSAIFRQVFHALKPGGLFLVTEPKGHVPAGAFETMILKAEKAAYTVLESTPSWLWYRILLQKPHEVAETQTEFFACARTEPDGSDSVARR